MCRPYSERISKRRNTQKRDFGLIDLEDEEEEVHNEEEEEVYKEDEEEVHLEEVHHEEEVHQEEVHNLPEKVLPKNTFHSPMKMKQCIVPPVRAIRREKLQEKSQEKSKSKVSSTNKATMVTRSFLALHRQNVQSRNKVSPTAPPTNSNKGDEVSPPAAPPTNSNKGDEVSPPAAPPNNSNKGDEVSPPAAPPNNRNKGKRLAVDKEPVAKLRKTRGPTRCIAVSKLGGSKLEVLFNPRGQAIGVNSIAFSSYLGHLGREMVPITYSDWRKVPNENKEYFWDAITQKFILNGPYAKTYTLQLMGKLWRAYKSRISRGPRPDGIDVGDWEKFMKKRRSKVYVDISTKFKKMRAKQELPYTASRKGYARLENDMGAEASSSRDTKVWVAAHRKKNGQYSSLKVADCVRKMEEILKTQGSHGASSFKDDILSQVLGPDRTYLRGLGGGASLSRLLAIQLNNENNAKMQVKVNELENNIRNMSILMLEQKKLIDFLLANKGQNVSSENDVHGSPQVQSNHYSPGSQHSHHSNTMIAREKGQKCMLMNWLEATQMVAKGRWISSDPGVKVHHVPLGRNASQCSVDEIIVGDALLWREIPDDDIKTIQDAIGSTVAWPTDFIIMISN